MARKTARDPTGGGGAVHFPRDARFDGVLSESSEPEEELSEKQKIEIAKWFLTNSPPGEIQYVAKDLRSVLTDEHVYNQAVSEAFPVYNKAHIIALEMPNRSGDVLVTEFGELSSNEYLDPRTAQVATIDHVKQVCTAVRPAEDEELPSPYIEDFRCALDGEIVKYVGEAYPKGISSVYCANGKEVEEPGADFELAVLISAARHRPQNFCNGSWHSIWRIEFKDELQIVDLQGTLQVGAHYFEEGNVQLETKHECKDSTIFQEMLTDPSKQVKLGYVSGLVPRDKSMAFERIIFRATRGNVFLKQAVVADPVTDPVSGEKVEKNVFVVFYSGERAKNKISKICDAFGANRYPFTDEIGKQAQMIAEVSGRLSELKTTIDVGLNHGFSLLKTIGNQFEQWNLLVRKEKAVYHTLNMLSIDVTRKCLVAEGWSPVFATKQIQDALQRAAYDSNSQVGAILQVLHTKESPPTYFTTNKFTSAFQDIVDAYGVAKYEEANPGVFTIVTFPFLFAVMFGDWGHGLYLLVASLIFISMEKKLSSQKLGDITEMTFGGRYVILMMSVFSIGLVYNEFFSVPFPIFGKSAYACRDLSCRWVPLNPFGVDPVWHGSHSELPFLNSLKMKMSILIGVAQMNLGIVLSYFNALISMVY